MNSPILRMTCTLAISVVCWAGPSFAQPDAATGRAAIKPSFVRLEPGHEQQFKVIMAPTRLRVGTVAQNVTWSVNNVPGGNEGLGTIDPTGLYRAPARGPSPHAIHICAAVEGAANRRLWATVLTGDPRPSYRLLRSWGEPVDHSVHLKDPRGIALDLDGNLLVTDKGRACVVRFTPHGEFLGQIGSGGNEPGRFDGPRDVLVDPAGRIFVSDVRTGPPRIQVFTPDGEYLDGFAQKGVGPGQVLRTRGMAFHPNQRLLVTDIDNMRLNVYTSSGKFLESWEKDGENPGQFNAPYGLVIDPNGDVFVPGYYGPCQKFTGQGVFLFAFAHADPPDGPVCFHSAAGDSWGNVYLAARSTGESPGDWDQQHGEQVTIMKYNNNGCFVTAFDLPPGELGENAMVVDASGQLHVVFNRADKVGVEVYVEQ